MRSLFAVPLASAAVLLSAACISSAPNHCGNNLGDATCAERNDALQFCSLCELANNGCVAAEPNQSCDFVETDTASTGPTTTNGPTTTTTDPTETTGPSSTTTGPACEGEGFNERCPEGMQYCIAGECVPCPDDTYCERNVADNPACDSDTGLCVECTDGNTVACEGNTPACGEDNACRGCIEHGECVDSGCHLEVGSCLPTDSVYWVEDCGAGGNGSMASPFCQFSDAIAAVGAGQEGTLMVMTGTYDQQVLIANSETIAIRGTTDVVVSHTIGTASVVVASDSIAYLDQFRIETNVTGRGLDCDGGIVWLDRMIVRVNLGGGVVVRSDGKLVVRNSAIANNGNDGADENGIFADSAELDIRYSTIAGNNADFNDSIECMGASGSIRNSILAGEDPNSIFCTGVTFANNAVDEDIPDNTNVGMNLQVWFQNWATGDYHLAGMGPMVLEDIAMFEDGDPPTDVDGDARPMGMPGFPGFDEP